MVITDQIDELMRSLMILDTLLLKRHKTVTQFLK